MIKLPIRHMNELLTIIGNKELYVYKEVSDLLYVYVLKKELTCSLILIDVISLILLGQAVPPYSIQIIDIEVYVRYGVLCIYDNSYGYENYLLHLDSFRWFNPRPQHNRKSIMLNNSYSIGICRKLNTYVNYINNLIDCYIFEGVLANTDDINPPPIMKEWGFYNYITSQRNNLSNVIDELENNYPIEVGDIL